MGLKFSNNAKGLVSGTVLASSAFVTIKDSKGGLYPSTYPYRCNFIKRVDGIVTQREIVEVTNKVGDTFTITRAVEACPASDSATTQTQTAFQFDDGDSFDLTRPNSRDEEIDTEFDNIINNYATKSELSDLETELQNQTNIYGTSTTGNDDYAITLSDPIPTSYNDLKGSYFFLADVGNTGIATLNINGLGAKTIKKKHDQDLGDGDIEANQKVEVVYNPVSDVFEMVSQVASVINIGEALYFGDGSDGDLVVTNGQTVTLDNDIYNYNSIDIQAGGIVNRTDNSPLQIKCKTTATIDGDIDLKGVLSTTSSIASSSNFALGLGVGGNGGQGGYRSGYPGGAGGTNPNNYSVGAGGAGGGSSNTNYTGGAGGNAGVPGGLGGAGGSNDQDGSPGGLSAGGGGGSNNVQAGNGGDAYGNDGTTASQTNNSGGGGGAGGAGGGILFLNALTVEGAGNIDCSGGVGGDGGVGYGGGGGAGGGGGGAVGIIYGTYTFSGTLDVTGGAGGLRGTNAFGTGGANGTAGTNGNSDAKNYNSLI